MKKLILVSGLMFLGLVGFGQALTSVNLLGSRFMADNSTQLFKTMDGKFLVFGTSANLGVMYADFQQGASTQFFVYSDNPDLPIREIQGAGGIAENDTTFVLIGQFEFPNQNAQVIAVKVTSGGKVLWARKLNSLSNDFADKIIRCQNGDYLISILSGQRENNCGNRISGSAVFRIDNLGNLLWYANLDTRGETNSKVLSMHELSSNNLVVIQNFSKQLSIHKLSSDGDSLGGILSDDELLPVAADFISDNDGFFVATATTALLKVDTSLDVKSFVQYAQADISSFTSVLNVNDSTVAIGGKYLNEACILNINSSTYQVRKVYHKSFFPYAGADIQGMFVVEDTFYSLLSNGFALSKHNSDLSHDCFEEIVGNQVSVSPQPLPDFSMGVNFNSEMPNFESLLGIYTGEKQDLQPSVNCLDYDLSIRTEFLEYNFSCRNIALRFYVFNNGTQAVSSFDITTYFTDGAITKSFNLNTPITSKTGAYIDFGNYYLDFGITNLSYKVANPEGVQDEYTINDSFMTVFSTIPNQTIGIHAADSICANNTNTFVSTGTDGTYSLFKDSMMVIQGTGKTYNVNTGGGLYRFMFENSKGCIFYSDTLRVKELAVPPRPFFIIVHDTLFTDASGKIYWYFNNVLSDSNTQVFLYKGTGNYKVITQNASGCESQNELINLTLSVPYGLGSKQYYFAENTLFLTDVEPSLSVELYSLDGRMLERFDVSKGASSYAIHRPAGLYFLLIRSSSGVFAEKVLIEN